MADNERGRARGIVVPPPLICLGPLALGLLLSRAVPSPFLPHGLSRLLRWPTLGGGAPFDRALFTTGGNASWRGRTL
jgi:hypothetical protein